MNERCFYTASLGIDPSKGAGQIRALARLYLFDVESKKAEALTDPVDRAMAARLTGVVVEPMLSGGVEVLHGLGFEDAVIDGDVGAAGSTGRGEANLYGLSSFLIVENMRRGMHPKDAGRGRPEPGHA